MNCLRLLACVWLTAGLHVKHLYNSGDFKLCTDFRFPKPSAPATSLIHTSQISFSLPPPQIQIRQAFPGERVELRCFHSKRGSHFAWFFSKTAPINSSHTSRDLVPLPQNVCFQRRFYEYGAFGVESMRVVSQTGTTGYFTCAENMGQKQWIQREIFLILLYQPATTVLNLDLISMSSVSCEEALSSLSHNKISFDRPGVSLEISVEASQCSEETGTWKCLTFFGTWTGCEWKRKPLKKSASGFIFTGPLHRGGRLRFEQVKVGFRIDFVHFTGGNKDRPIVAGSFALVYRSLCEEARRAGPRFEWMILEVHMGYAELAGGYRIPFNEMIAIGKLELLDGLQFVGQGGGAFESVYLEYAPAAEAILERTPLPPSDLSSGVSMTAGQHWQRLPCHPPVSASGMNYVTSAHTQLCTQQETIFHTVLTGAVSQMPRRSGLSIIVRVDAFLLNGKIPENFYQLRLMERSFHNASVLPPSLSLVQLLTISWNNEGIHCVVFDGSHEIPINATLETPSTPRNITRSCLVMQISKTGTSASLRFTLGKEKTPQFTKELPLTTTFNNGLELITSVPPQRACKDCFVIVHVDRRGASSNTLERPKADWHPQPFLPPINNRATQLGPMAVRRRRFKAFRVFSIRWTESPLAEAREDFRDWFDRVQRQAAAHNVTVIYNNSWPVCPMGQHLGIAKPPFCIPCPPGTAAVAYKSTDKATYSPQRNETDLNTPHAILCDTCPKGFYQSEPGQRMCIDCSTDYNTYLCDERPLAAAVPEGTKGDFLQSSSLLVNRSTTWIQVSTTVNRAGILLICFCLIGLLAAVVYFYIKAIAFMLLLIAKKDPSSGERHSCSRDLNEMERQELCRTAISSLRSLYPEINWNKIICEAAVTRLHENYPYIRWEKILSEELPYVLRSRYPHINWDKIVAEDACGREIDHLRAENPEMDWTTVLCEARISSLRKKFPCLNWDAIICEERIQRLRAAYPDVDFDALVRNTFCEYEINYLKRQLPEVDWETLMRTETAFLPRARHPLVHRDTAESENLAHFKHNMAHVEIYVKELINSKKRFSQLEGETIVRGEEARATQLSKVDSIERLHSCFPNVAWENIIKNDLCENEIMKLRDKYDYIDWDAITRALFHSVSAKSVNVKDPRIHKRFKESVARLEKIYPFIDWDYLLENKHSPAYINWEYIIEYEDGGATTRCERLSPATIDKLKKRYRFVNWDAFQNVGVDQIMLQHPYIRWAVVLEEHGGESQNARKQSAAPMRSREVSQEISVRQEEGEKESTMTTEQEIDRLLEENPHINWKNVIAKEMRRKSEKSKFKVITSK